MRRTSGISHVAVHDLEELLVLNPNPGSAITSEDGVRYFAVM
jgi:hypothetical protein